MPEFENPDLELPAVEGEVAPAPPPPPPGEQGKIQDLGEQFENTETPEVEQGEIVDGPSELNELVSTDLQPTTMDMPQTELGTGAYQTKEPYGSGEGDIEMKTFSSNESSNAELAETDANDFHEQLDTGNADADVNPEAQVDNPVEQTVEQETTQIGEEGADVTADVADVADAAAETGLEAAGAALDATGVGSIIGLVLGFVGAGIGVAQAVEGTNETNKEASDEEQETSLDSAKNTIQANLAKQQFVGANVMAALSSTTAQNVTSAAF